MNTQPVDPIKIVVVGVGKMGRSHALAYHNHSGFEITGIVTRTENSATVFNAELGSDYPWFSTLEEALAATPVAAVSINTYTDTHASFAKIAFAAGCHVFMEKPIGRDVEESEQILSWARASGKKLVIGYILRVHPVWQRFITESRSLGTPLVMRMNLNQQSSGHEWEKHKNILRSQSPIVDCGVHYIDIMCQMTRSQPVSVSAIGARLSDEIAEDAMNYGQLQVRFADGSIGWYEAGWGPMISETAFFVKDVIGPRGSVSIKQETAASDDVDSHTQTNALLLHSASRNSDGSFSQEDQLLHSESEPSHDDLCALEQEFFYQSIINNKDLTEHWIDALNSLRIAMAADESARTGQTVELT